MERAFIEFLNFENTVEEIRGKIKNGVFPFSEARKKGDCLSTDMLCYDDSKDDSDMSSLILSKAHGNHIIYKDYPIVKSWTRTKIVRFYGSDDINCVLRKSYNQKTKAYSCSVRIRIKNPEANIRLEDTIGVNISSKGFRTFVSRQQEIEESYRYAEKTLNEYLSERNMMVKLLNDTDTLYMIFCYDAALPAVNQIQTWVNIPSFWKAKKKIVLHLDELIELFEQIKKRCKNNTYSSEESYKKYLYELADATSEEMFSVSDTFERFEEGEMSEGNFACGGVVFRIFVNGRYVFACPVSGMYGFSQTKKNPELTETINENGVVFVRPTVPPDEYQGKDDFHWEVEYGTVTAVYKDSKGNEKKDFVYQAKKEQSENELSIG